MEAGTPQLVKLEELRVPGQLSGRKHILSILVENKPGVLARVAGLFSRRGFNIDTLAVGPTDDESISRITLTLDGAVHPIDQVTKQLHKLVNVLKIRDMEPEETVAREMAMFKVSAAVENRAEIIQFAEIFRAKIVDVARRTMTIEVTGSADKIEAFERMIRPHGLIEMVRTGEIAIARGSTENDGPRRAMRRPQRPDSANRLPRLRRWRHSAWAAVDRALSGRGLCQRHGAGRGDRSLRGGLRLSAGLGSLVLLGAARPRVRPRRAWAWPTRRPRAGRSASATSPRECLGGETIVDEPPGLPAGAGAVWVGRLRLRSRGRRLLDLVVAGAGLAGLAGALDLPQRRGDLPHRQRRRPSRRRPR